MEKSDQGSEVASQCSHCKTSEDSDSAPFLGGKRKNKYSFSIIRSPYMLCIDAILATAFIWLLVVQHTTRRTQLDCQGDISGYVPNFSNQLIVFEQQPHFISNHSSEASLVEAQQHWKSLVPPGQGFLDISEKMAAKYAFPKLITYELPAELSTTGAKRHGKSLGTSVVHSLHCLWTMMAEYDLVYQGKEPLNLEHMDHCYEYIRQVLMCSGDMALAGETFPGGSSQFGVTHVCRNWGEIYEFLDRNRVSTAWQFGDPATHFVPPTK